MTVDREQVRRDENSFANAATWRAHALGLLAELEQAERERDERGEIIAGMAEAFARYEARLGKVPALVEALRELAASEADELEGPEGHVWASMVAETAQAALNVWERE